MASSDLTTFIQDRLLQFDPTLDLSEGSKADSELVQPIVQRVGLDPFDDDILTFVRERVRQSFPNLAITELDPLTDTVLDPMRVIIEPVVREIKLVKLRGQVRNIETLSDDEVDALMGNFFAARVSGGFAVGVVRIFFSTPQSISITQTNPATTKSGLRFFPTRPQAITADQMLLNVDGTEHYFDVNYTAENRGDNYNVEVGEVVSAANLPTATRITNQRRFRGGTPREASVDFAARVQASQGDKTLTVDRGVIATLTESFPDIARIFTVGFRDPEMMRDVIKGGSLGPIPDPDVFGSFFGTATPTDNLDGDLITPLLTASGGHFVSRIAAAGVAPDGWFLTLTYNDGSLKVKDVQILLVISDTEVKIDTELPVSLAANSVTWMLRQRRLTISDIPGGIVLPDSAAGTLEIVKDEVHIGGKTDVYIAGDTDLATAQITSLTDELPSAKGANAQTAGTNVVTLNDPDGVIQAGMSLVLEEGVDAGSYRILEIVSVGPPMTLHLDVTMTGSQGSLAWKVVDEIDVELTDPKDIKVEGSDLVTAAGNPVVLTASATNFVDANVQIKDILQIEDDTFGGEFTITQVNAVSLSVDPAPQRTFAAVAYRIFRRSEAVDPPVVRVQSLELLDSSGAPSGTKIPYRDPVLALSNAFQNEGSGFVFEDLCNTGLVTTPSSGTTFVGIGGKTLVWESYDKDQAWLSPLASGTLTFSGSPSNKTPTQIAADINADAGLDAAGIKAIVITKNSVDYVGIVSTSLVRIVSGTALSISPSNNLLTWPPGYTNASMESVVSQFSDDGVRTGDLIEIAEGNNGGVQARVVAGPIHSGVIGLDVVSVGNGPVGPEALNGIPGLYNAQPLSPDVRVIVRIGRASVGSARVYFLAPTSAEFDYRTTRFTTTTASATLAFEPDPENLRTIIPAPPLTDLPGTGVTASGSPGSLTDASANFLLSNVQPGDLLDVLYVPITGTGPLPTPGNIAFTGSNNTLRIRLGTDPFITVSFPFPMTRQAAVDFINTQVGEDIASIATGGELQFKGSVRIEIDPTSTVVTDVSDPLFLAGLTVFNSDHPDHGVYIVATVGETVLTLSVRTAPLANPSITDTFYRIQRYIQRISSTEMNTNLEASGLYFADVQMVALGPGDIFNIPSGIVLEVTGHRSDGYRLLVANPVTTFSRAEVLKAKISRSMLLVGSADDPTKAVQLSQQNVQVTYDRSSLVDSVQSFCDSDFQRVLCEEILVRHLLPHYLSLAWNYAAGSSEADMTRALNDALGAVEPDTQLEVSDLTDVLRRRAATSVFTPDSSSTTGRTAPFFVVVYHDDFRVVRALIVKDFVLAVRAQRYIPDNIVLRRITTGGIR